MLSLSRYQQVLSLPGAKALLLWSLLSRAVNVPLGAIVLITAYGACGDWAIAGIAAALAAGAAALSSWLLGTIMDRFSVRQVMLWTAPGFLSLLGLSLLAQGNTETCIWALISGLTRPATGTAIRSLWASLTQNQETRRVAYAMESGLVPLAGAAGVAIAGLIASTIGPQQVGTVATIIGLISAIGLAQSEAAKHCQAQPRPERPRKRQPLGMGSWAALLAIGAAWAALSATEVGLGDARGAGQLGMLSACGFIAVAIGAHIYSGHSAHQQELTWVTRGLGLSITAGIMLFLGVEILSLCIIAMLIIGFSRGMVSPASTAALAHYAPQSRQSEAMGLYGSVVLLGQVAGRPIGSLLLKWGPGWPMLAAALVSGAAAAAVWAAQRRLSSKASGSS